MTLLFFYIVLALGVSFLCSIMEAVLLSLTPAFVIQMEESSPSVGKSLRRFKEDVENPLAAILSLNTIAHTVGAAGAGAQAAHIFGDAYVGVISAALTLLILILSEILPKTLGALYWRELASSVTRLLGFTLVIMYPLVKLSRYLTRFLTRGKENKVVDREEITALTRLGVREGVINKNESQILDNLLRFREILVKDIMTPRTVIFSLDEQWTVGEVLDKEGTLHFSRIPVFSSNHDDITGFVLKADVLLELAQGRRETSLVDLKRPITAVSKYMELHKLFDIILNSRTHIALVLDNYGGTEGLVTQEDLIETLLGMEIVDEADRVEDMQKLARKKWEQRARKMGLEVDRLRKIEKR